MPGEYAILRSLLSDRPIAFHPMLARVFGGINEALLFQQLAYWSDKGSDPEWIYKTQRDIEFETTLTRTQQENARRKLRGLGVVEEDKRGVPAKLYYRVIWERVFEILESDAGKDAGNLQTRMQGNDILVSSEPAGKHGVRTESITENTQRELTDRPLEYSKGLSTDKKYDEAREWLLPFVQDFAVEMRDTAPASSTVSRLVNIFRRSGLTEDEFIDRMYQARQVTKERTRSVNTGEGGKKRLMPYFLTVLERSVTDSV
jgi:hypothetical protein